MDTEVECLPLFSLCPPSPTKLYFLHLYLYFYKVQSGFGYFQEEPDIPEEPVNNQNLTPLPILYTEDGAVILRFSEIFGIHKSSKKSEKRECRYSVPKGNIFFIPSLNVYLAFLEPHSM